MILRAALSPRGALSRPLRRPRRSLLRTTSLVVLLAVSALAAPSAHAVVGVETTTPTTIVSLTFDDGTATEFQAGQMLADHGMNGTFYVNSSRLGSSDYYMSWDQVQALAAMGNEIGGHTAHHVDLQKVDPTEAKRQICQDRVNLIDKGFTPMNLAYPFGSYNANVESMAQQCGYNSARTSTPKTSETIPPADPYAIREATGSGDLTTLKNAVMAAEQSGGGWVPIVFHQICNACDTSWIKPADLQAFLDWLAPRAANGTGVEKVSDVIGGTSKPAVQPPPAPQAPNGYNGVRNSSLETDANGDGLPDCTYIDSFGSNRFDWTRTTDAHTGSFAEKVTITGWVSGDSKLGVVQDLGFCTPSVTPGRQYRVTTWYKSDSRVAFQAFTRNSLGGTDFWRSSPSFNAASAWTKATWVTPVIPNGVTGLSFGLALPSNGTLTVDDIGFDDASPTGSADSTAPSASLASPAANATVAGIVPISANASDDIQVDHVDFLVDGAFAGAVSIPPYTYNWNARSVANGTHTLAARAVDTAGNATTTAARTVLVANSALNLVQNPSLETATGSTPTCWTLGGFGTNTFAWTRTSNAHSGSFAEKLDISSWTTGDRKLVSTQSATCGVAATPGHSYSVSAWYQSPQDTNLSGTQPVFFAYYLNASGAWVFWAQSPRQPASSTWRQATWSTPALPAGATAISAGMGINTVGTVTMDDLAISDNAPPADTTPPTSAITCDGGTENGGCKTGYYNTTVQVALTATDDEFGSGLASIRYTTDGTDPSATNGSTYDGVFAVPPPGATVKWRAFDKAGNAEAVHSQLVRIDTAPPTSSATCDGAPCSDTSSSGSAVSVALSAADTGGSGVREIRYTTDGSDPTATTGTPYVGAFSVTQTTVVKFRAFDNAGNAGDVGTVSMQVDAQAPTSRISCDTNPCSTSTYTEPVSVSLSATDEAGGSGVAKIVYTTDGTIPDPSSGTVYTAPFTVSTTTRVRFRAVDNAGNVEGTNGQLITVSTVTLASPTAGATVSGSVGLTASTTNAFTASVRYQVDGQAVGSAALSPYAVSWDSTTVPDGTHTITAQALDGNGVVLDSDSAPVTVDNGGATGDTAPPVTTIECNLAPCSVDAYSASVSVRLTATDGTGGSGVKQIRYTTDGSLPTATSGTVYGGSFSVTTTTTVKYLAIDNAGNVEDVHTQTIQIDRTAPMSSIFCGGTTCASSYYTAAVSVTLGASDSGGSGVKEIRYTTDGSDPTATSGTVFTDAFSLAATTTVKYRAYDNAGNAEPINSALIKVDTTAPATTIACNGGGCTGAFKPGASIALTATDADSGVSAIRYTTNGTVPTANTGTVYSAPFTLNASATVTFRAFDNIGNAEVANTQQVTIDGTAPTVSVASPTAGSIVSGTTPLTATAADNLAIDHVDLLVDGQVVGTATGSPYTASWDTAAAGDGAHAITARAVDTAGNTTTSSSVSVTVANSNLLKNASLETGTATTPTCWTLAGFGTSTFTWTRGSDAHSGSFGETLNVTSWTSGDRKLVSTQDTGTCAPAGTPGRTYVVSAWYKSTATPVVFAYYRNSSGSWVYWSESKAQPAAADWTKVTWTTPALPAGATAVSVGLGIKMMGTMSVDDLALSLG